MTEINRETLLTIMRDEAQKPLSISEIEELLGVTDSSQFKAFVKLLNELEEEGVIVRTRKNRYGLPEKMNLKRGEVIMHPKGFAFVRVDEEDEDIYIASADMNGAMNKDRVIVRLYPTSSGARREGTIIRILERGVVQTVGTYVDDKYYGFVIPDDKRIPNDIFIPKGKEGGAVDGHKVVVHITKYPEGRMSAEGQVIDILGHKNDPGVDILSIIHKYGLPGDFAQETLDHANSIPDEISEKDMENRRDLREETIVTIDGEDAKDLDDAVQVKKLENGNYKLGVHIADVSYYVTDNSPIDLEAKERATSVYLVDRVIPMIPHRLSNGICSLNPNVDRLTLSVEMEITPQGKVVNHEIFESVIRSTERMTYNDVRKILEDEDEETIKKYESLVPMFKDMAELAGILRNKRMERGAIDFDFKEAKVIVDEEGNPTDIELRNRSIAERIIEEFMLAANETVAEHFHWMKVPFIYRIHEDPDEEKMANFLEFITNFGYVVKGAGNSVHPRALQELLTEVKGEPEEAVINTVLLRSMKQAKYDPKNVGHFGLSADFYTHFTAPIRRYPDLIVHRLIRTYLIEGKTDGNTLHMWEERLEDITRHSSEMERRAEDASRETDELKKVQYMLDKIGEEYEGIISGVTNFGLFVELPNTVEGLVHVSYLTDDYYHYDEKQYAMIGERTGNVFRIGDVIEVRVVNVNVDERIIDFEIVGMKKRKVSKKQKPRVIEGEKRTSRGKKTYSTEKMGLDLSTNHKRKKKKKKKK